MQYKSREAGKFLEFKSTKSVKLFVSISLLILTSLFCLSLYYIRNLSSEYNIKQFFPKRHQLIEQEKAVIKHFKIQEKSSLILLLKQPKDNKWTQKDNLLKLREFSNEINNNENVLKSYSLGTIQGSFEIKNNLYVGDLFAQVPDKYWSQMIKTHPFIKPSLLSQNENETLLVVELKENSPKRIQGFKNSVVSLKNKVFKNVILGYGGVPLLQSDVASLLKSELIRSIFYGLIIFIFALIAIFNNWSGIAISILCLLFINIVTLGFLSYLKIKLDVLLSTLPVLISLATVSLTVQILVRCADNANYYSDNLNTKFNAIIQNLKNLFVENLLASLTTSIGFLMLTSSDVTIISKYGKSVSMTILLSWLLTQLFIVPLLTVLPAAELRQWSSKKAYWSLPLLKFSKPIVCFTVLLFIIGGASFSYLNWNSRLFDDLPKNSQTRINTEKVDSQFGGTIPVSIVLYGQSQAWTQPQNLRNLDLLSKEIKSLRSVGTVISSADFFKKSSLTGVRLPASNAEATESLFVFSMAESDPTVTFLNQIKNLTRIEVRLKDLPSNVQSQDIKKVESLIKKFFPQMQFSISGMGITAHRLNKEMSRELIFGFWQSLAVIGFLLVFIFKNIRWALVACLPNLVPPLALILLLAINKTPIKPGIAIIFSIAIGLAFTNTVYLLGKLKKVVHEKNLRHYLPIKQMLVSEMIPCLLATLLVTSAFVVFTFSYFEMNKIFGVYMVLSLLAGAFGDLLFLPSLLKTYPHLLLGPTEKKTKLKHSLAFTSVMFLLVFHPKLQAAPSNKNLDVEAILKKSQSLLKSHDDQALVTMKIIEADGSVKERQLSIKRKFSQKKHMTLVKLKKPVDLKGTALLSVFENGSEDQWLYLPSTKQTRRVMGQNKKSGVLGSELTAEDLDVATIKGSKAKLVKEIKCGSETCALIEVKSNANGTRYSKALFIISLKSFLPQRLEYYNANNKPIKRVDFENYIRLGQVYRAQSIRVKNLVNKRGTDLILSQIKSNSGLSEDEFSQRALSKD